MANLPRALALVIVALAGVVACAGFACADGGTLAGYESRVRGEVLEYHSPDPDVTRALLVRSLDAARGIEWKTAAVPADFGAGVDGAEFVWMFGIAVTPEGHRFELSVDGKRALEFRNPADAATRDWTVAGEGGVSVRFRATMVDRYGDLMGYATLRVPKERLTPGKAVTVGVTGESAGSRTWYMTFMTPVIEESHVAPRPAIVRAEKGATDYQPLILSVTHLGSPTDAVINTSFGPQSRARLELGGNRIELRLPDSPGARDVTVRVRIGDEKQDRYTLTARVQPVRHWTIDLVQHTHTDIGYSRPQTEILAEHLRFIDTALDECDATDAYPEDAKFRWTCETSWAVREWLKCRPAAQIERLRERCAEGRIEVTGMFLCMSEIMDEASYPAFLEPVKEFRAAGLPVTTAMQDDVNGVAWCLADYFQPAGIEYLVMGQHGHRALVPFDIPTCFWWQSPGGNKVLAYRADHYHTGNFWAVHTGKVEMVEDEALRYLAGLEARKYPFDRVAVQHSGYHTDNSPPSIASSGLVKEWNEKYIWPHLRCAVAREFPKWVKEKHPKEIPTFKLAWTDWWTDGFGSAARETAAARVTQSRLTAAEGLLAMQQAAGLAVPASVLSDIGACRDDLIFWGEHTLGAAESIREPLSENTQVQWAEKSSYAWDGAKREAVIEEGALGRLGAAVPKAEGPQLVVFNALSFPRSGVLEINVDREIMPRDGTFRIIDDAGKDLSVQQLSSREDGSWWAIWCPEMPALGRRTFRIEKAGPSLTQYSRTVKPDRDAMLNNRFYQITIDHDMGAIRSLVDKSDVPGHEGTLSDIVSHSAVHEFGQIIHETLGNREQLEALTLESVDRRVAAHCSIESASEGPIWSSVTSRAEVPGCEEPGGVRCEVRLFHPEKRVELHYTIRKRREYQPEALYVAFPLVPPSPAAEPFDEDVYTSHQPSQPGLALETLGGIVNPARDLLPGASSDWQAMQSFFGASWSAGQVIVSSPEIPLIQCGGLNLGQFRRNAKVEHPWVYSWVMNNYWTTNFCASQEGEFKFSYAITSTADTSRAAATRFGWATRVPLLGRIIPAGAASASTPPPPSTASAFPIPAANLMLIAARPTADGVFLHIRELDGNPAKLDTSAWRMAGEKAAVSEVNVLGQNPVAVEGAIEFAPYQVRFLRVSRR